MTRAFTDHCGHGNLNRKIGGPPGVFLMAIFATHAWQLGRFEVLETPGSVLTLVSVVKKLAAHYYLQVRKFNINRMVNE